MERKAKIVLFIVSTILSLAMIFLSYFGFVRYTTLYIKSSDSYIENYTKLPHGGSGRVVISFTTVPERMDKLKPMLNSLLDQTVRVDQIALNLPYNHKGVKYDVPKEYTNMLNVFKVGKDYGPGCKIIPTLLREGEVGTKIIYLDDDQIYGKDFVETLIEESEKYPDSAIYTKEGMNASGGVLIKPEFFDSSVIDSEKTHFDDAWMKKHLKTQARKVDYSENYRMVNM